MTLLFDRKYSLIIGKPVVNVTVPKSIALKDSFTATEWQSGSDWVKSNSGGALEITDLQMTAKIQGSANASGGANTSTITVHNMASSTRELVEVVGNYVILKAGYAQDEELKVIFTGQVSSFETRREGADLITVFQCSDAYTPNNSVRVSKKFIKGNTWKDVIDYLVGAYQSNGVPLGEFISDWTDAEFNSRTNVPVVQTPPQNYVQLPVIRYKPANTKLINGYSINGTLYQALKVVCDQIGYVSYITNGSIYIHPKGFTKMVEQYEFSQDQMKSIRKMGTQVTNGALGKGITGIKIKTFLDGRIDINKRIKIIDGDYDGSYKVISSSFELDYRGGVWDVSAELQQEDT